MNPLPMKPIRIQRKRIKGYKLPENTISVTRPGKWGNPYQITKIKGAVQFLYCLQGPGRDGWAPWFLSKEEATAKAVSLFSDWIRKEIASGHLDITELRGKNLACFCPIGSPCHADVLLGLANQALSKMENRAQK